jgi:hypothetical protein
LFDATSTKSAFFIQLGEHIDCTEIIGCQDRNVSDGAGHGGTKHPVTLTKRLSLDRKCKAKIVKTSSKPGVIDYFFITVWNNTAGNS